MKSKFLSLDIKDFIKGLIIALITAILTFLIDLLQIGSSFDAVQWGRLIIAVVVAFLSYLLKNLFSNSKDQLLTKEPII